MKNLLVGLGILTLYHIALLPIAVLVDFFVHYYAPAVPYTTCYAWLWILLLFLFVAGMVAYVIGQIVMDSGGDVEDSDEDDG